MEESSLTMDILLSHPIDELEAQHMFAKIFNIEKDNVFIEVESSYDKIENQTQVLCRLVTIEGDFVQMLSIFILDKDLKFSDEQIAQACSIYLNIECLLPDEDINPYSMLLFYPNGQVQKVFLNPDNLELDKYTIYR